MHKRKNTRTWSREEKEGTCNDNMKKLHILSKLLKIWKNERISTKLIFACHRSPKASLSTWKSSIFLEEISHEQAKNIKSLDDPKLNRKPSVGHQLWHVQPIMNRKLLTAKHSKISLVPKSMKLKETARSFIRHNPSYSTNF